jgi:hypothetical protein
VSRANRLIEEETVNAKIKVVRSYGRYLVTAVAAVAFGVQTQ